MTERERFEQHLKEDPYDFATRLVYSDWLEEQGLDDEAIEQRRRATDEWRTAREWLKQFAIDCHEDANDPPSPEEVAGYASVFHDKGVSEVLSGMGFGAENAFADDAATFWRMWEAFTGRVCKYTPQDIDSDPYECSPFVCGC